MPALTSETGQQILQVPVLQADDGTIYFTARDGFLHGLEPDGSQRLRVNIGGPAASPNLAPNGTLYLRVAGGPLHAIRTNSRGLARGPWPKSRQDIRNQARARYCD